MELFRISWQTWKKPTRECSLKPVKNMCYESCPKLTFVSVAVSIKVNEFVTTILIYLLPVCLYVCLPISLSLWVCLDLSVCFSLSFLLLFCFCPLELTKKKKSLIIYSSLFCFSRPSQETLTEYHKKVELLKGLIEVEKMVTFDILLFSILIKNKRSKSVKDICKLFKLKVNITK